MRIARWLPRFREASKSLAELYERESWSRGRIESFQIERINSLWAHAIGHVPYYINLAREHQLPERFDSLEHFCATVPLLPKTQVRENGTALLSSAPGPGGWKHSSGTTGRPTNAYWSHDSHRESLHAKYRFYDSWGADVFARTVFLWGPGTSPARGLYGSWSRFRQPYLDRLRNRLRLSALECTKPRMRDYLKRIAAFKPVMIYGYSRALYLLGMEAEAVGFTCPSLKVIVATSEPAWPHMIERIERGLGAPVAREYGAMECGIVATDAPDKTLRVREDQVLVETPQRDDGQYDIVVTCLINPSFPLIRYVTGDLTDRPIVHPDKGFAMLGSIAGRSNDLLRKRGGEFMHWVHIENGVLATVQDLVRRFTVHQKADGSVLMNVELDDPTRAGDVTAPLAALTQYLEERLEGYPVTVRVVESVAQTAAGKHRVVSSDLYDLNTSAAPDLTPQGTFAAS